MQVDGISSLGFLCKKLSIHVFETVIDCSFEEKMLSHGIDSYGHANKVKISTLIRRGLKKIWTPQTSIVLHWQQNCEWLFTISGEML